jgi:RNA polymerase sigma-70 factor (ECF subfamily)
VDDERRFRALFAEAYPALRRYAHHRGLSPSDADDLVSGVLTIAWRRFSLVPEDDPLPWLFATARNLWWNEQRSQRRRARLHDRVAATPDTARTSPGAAAAADELAERAPSFDAIRDALTALSEDDQELLRLIAWDGLTPSQAAVVLGCTDAAARVRLHRARTRFAAELAARTNDQEAIDDTAATH